MKVKVKGIAVFYDGKHHEKDAELTIEEAHYNESLFLVVEEAKKKKATTAKE